jgi:hypothetical protein
MALLDGLLGNASEIGPGTLETGVLASYVLK